MAQASSTEELVFDPCKRCGGDNAAFAGYRKVNGGICFLCNGEQGAWVSRKVIDDRAKAAARRAAKAEAKIVARKAHHASQLSALTETYPVLAVWSDSLETPKVGALLYEIWMKGFDYDWSEKQIAAVVKILTKQAEFKATRAAEKAEMTAAPEGRVTITGPIQMIRVQDSDYGITYKMIIKDDRNFKVWSTVPAALLDTVEDFEELKGQTVTMTVTLTPSNDDKTFAFGKRPLKAQVV